MSRTESSITPRREDVVRHKNGGTIDHIVTDSWTAGGQTRVELDDRGVTYPATSLDIVKPGS